MHVEIDDATPPSIQADASDSRCVSSPRHWWACYGRADFHPVVTDDCGAPPTWRFLDCTSDQPADDVGDGHADPDCLVTPDVERIGVRAERHGGEPAGRTYSVTASALDSCGNASEAAIGTITVPAAAGPSRRDSIVRMRPGPPAGHGRPRHLRCALLTAVDECGNASASSSVVQVPVPANAACAKLCK